MTYTDRMLMAGHKAAQAKEITPADVTREAVRRAAELLGVEMPKPAAVRLDEARRLLNGGRA